MFSLMVSLAVCGQIISYVDAEGTTHFVESPSQIPAKYRKKAKALETELSTVAPQKLTKEEEAARLAKEQAAKERAGQATRPGKTERKPEATGPTAQRKERDAYDKAASEMQIRCYGDNCVVQQTLDKPALKPGESCRPVRAACTVPPECCSKNCNSNTFTCE
jgi:hypothetical protein